MSLLESRLLRRELVADQTIACRIARPAGFVFEPGQYVDVTLVDPPYDDAQGRTRSMSIASAPEEEDLLLLMRLRDTAFKRSLAALPAGAPLLLDGPADDLGFPRADDPRPLVLIAGGVGVAPFLALLRSRAATGRPLAATLFYSNRRPEDAAYLAELDALAERIDGFRHVPTMTRAGESSAPWPGETARLDAAMLARHLPALAGPRYYVSGSTALVSGLCQELERSGIPPRDIRIEMYAGY